MSIPTFATGQKFAMMAIGMVHTDLPDYDFQLSDGTWVLNHVPVEIQKHWIEWIGSIRTDQVRHANLVLLRLLDSANPETAGDEEQFRLTNHLNKLFSLLQLGGILEYWEADILAGSVLDDLAMIRHASRLPKFHNTKGYTRKPVTLARLEAAASIHCVIEQIEKAAPQFARFLRGLNILKSGLLEDIGQERLHQFVRALEALVLPATGATKRQFTHRCQTFAKASPQAKAILEEAFDMRSDAEHVQDWNRALRTYPTAEREDVALQRTRQMEYLVTSAYSRILTDVTLRTHFVDDFAQENFWKLPDGDRVTIWGKQFDLGSIPVVRKYDPDNRAA
jgi:hypothetical protein